MKEAIMQKKNIETGQKEAYTEDDMALGVRAVSDIVFKYIFGTEESTDILKSFINAVLTDAGYPVISEVSVVNPFNLKTYTDEKMSIIDTRARDEAGNIYNVEVQIRSQSDFQERSLYYWAKSYAEQLPEGQEYVTLHKVISISILDFKLFAEHIPFHSCFMLRENGNLDYVLSTDCVLHYLETPKLRREPATEIEQWLYLLLHAGKEDERMKVLIDNNKYFEQAMRRYEHFVADEPSRLAYEARQKFLHDQASYLGDARREGHAEGHAEGLAEGERKKALETAEKLLLSGLSLEQIAEATGLSVEDVKGTAAER
jgi:predicted transposase/invertase (TIGR01784 family)